MKNAKPAKRGAGLKRKSAPKTVEEYLARLPEPTRTTLKKVRAAIRMAMPRKAIEIISYGIPAYKHNGILVWFAAFSHHCSLFPTASVIKAFKNELGSYTLSKGTIQFPIDKALPSALVRKLVKARVAQNESKKRR